MRQVNAIILHWIGQGNSMSYTTQDSVDGIRNYHVNVNGWSDIGYHYLISRDGTIFDGRPEDLVGAHAYGFNSNSIGVCILYGTDDTIITEATMDALVKKLRELCVKYGIKASKDTIIGHRDVMATECPGIVYPLIPQIIARVNNQPIVNATGAMAHPPETDEIGRIRVKYGNAIYDGIIINSQSFVNMATLAKMFDLDYKWIGEEKTVELKRKGTR